MAAQLWVQKINCSVMGTALQGQLLSIAFPPILVGIFFQLESKLLKGGVTEELV